MDTVLAPVTQLTFEQTTDIDLVRRLRNSGVGKYVQHNYNILPRENNQYWIQNKDNTIVELAKLAGGQIVGFYSVRQSLLGLFVFIVVDPIYQGKGYGTQIYQHMMNTQFEDTYFAEIRLDNYKALKLFLHNNAEVWSVVEYRHESNSLVIKNESTSNS